MTALTILCNRVPTDTQPQGDISMPAIGLQNGDADGALLATVLMMANAAGAPQPGTPLFDNVNATAENASAARLGTMNRATVFNSADASWYRATALFDNADAQAVSATLARAADIARLQGFNGATWDRLRTVADNADGQAALTLGQLSIMARGQGFNGATFDRLRTLSAANLATFLGLGGLIAAPPGEWAIQHTPAAATQATITRAAGGAGVRHVCKSITCSILATAVQAQIILNLRDGTTGAGTILWSAQFALAAGGSDRIALSGLNIVGSAATAMTLEVAAAPAATNFASVALTGTDAS